MRRRAWRAFITILTILAAAAATMWIWLRYDFEKVNWTWGVIAGFVAVYVVVDQVFKNRELVPGALAAHRRAAADELADLVRRDRAEEPLLRSLEEPYPLPVAWTNAPEELTPSWRTICRSSDATRLDLTGLTGPLRECFERIPSGRLLVLGPPGSGKSIMALRLARQLAAERSPDGPVPVLLTAASWNPSVAFREWIVAQIASRYPQFSTVYPRWNETLGDLLDAELILPILDGLDEASEEHATRCLQQLNLMPTQRLVVTCRTDVYERYLVEGEKLRGAAVIEIQSLDPARVADYLVDAAPPHQEGNWRLVQEEISASRNPELAAALSTPLMVAMARTAFGEPGTDPRRLVPLARRRGRQRVEDDLLNAAVDSALLSRRGNQLPVGWRPRSARRYLSFLAGHLEAVGQREFLWWRLPAEVPRAVWVIFDGLRAGLAVLVAMEFGVAALRTTASAVGDDDIRRFLLIAVEHSGVTALAAGGLVLVVSAMDAIEGWRGVPPTRIAFRGGIRSAAWGAIDGIFFGLLLGAILWLALRILKPPDRVMAGLTRYSLPIESWPDSLTVALTAGLVILALHTVRGGLRVDLSAPAGGHGVRRPARLIGGDRAATALSLITTVATGVVLVVVTFRVLAQTNALPTGPAVADQVYAGLGAGLGVWIYRRAGGAWIRFGLARIVLAARRRVPLRLLRFLDFAEAIGLLRSVDGAYRFRHRRLQTRLATHTEEGLREARRQGDFAAALARVGYWDEALAINGGILAARTETLGLGDGVAADALRGAVLVGCVGGRLRRLAEQLNMVPSPAVTATDPHGELVAARRRELDKLVRADAPLAQLLEVCNQLVKVERVARRHRTSTREFRAALLFALDRIDDAEDQVDEVLTDDSRTHPAPVAAALRARLALDLGDLESAMAACQEELQLDGPADEALLVDAESWYWSVRVLGRVLDEVADLRRRLIAAADEAAGRRIRITKRELVDLGWVLSRRMVGRPAFAGLALQLTQLLVDEADKPDAFRLTINRSAPMWHQA